MSITACRLTKAKYRNEALEGLGSLVSDGRWHRRGIRMVYASDHPALALLETMVHLGSTELLTFDYVVIPLQFDASIIATLEGHDLPDGWNSWPWPPVTQQIGTRWITEGHSAVLRVPSAVAPAQANYLINPTHPDTRRIVVGDPEPFPIDPRLGQT